MTHNINKPTVQFRRVIFTLFIVTFLTTFYAEAQQHTTQIQETISSSQLEVLEKENKYGTAAIDKQFSLQGSFMISGQDYPDQLQNFPSLKNIFNIGDATGDGLTDFGHVYFAGDHRTPFILSDRTNKFEFSVTQPTGTLGDPTSILMDFPGGLAWVVRLTDAAASALQIQEGVDFHLAELNVSSEEASGVQLTYVRSSIELQGSGWMVHSPGDLNNDGYSDVLIYTSRPDPSSQPATTFFVVMGGATASDLIFYQGQVPYPENGIDMTISMGATSINNDDMPDIFVARAWAETGGTFRDLLAFTLDTQANDPTMQFQSLGGIPLPSQMAEGAGTFQNKHLTFEDITGDGYDELFLHSAEGYFVFELNAANLALGDELLTNGDFSDGLNGWSTYNADFAGASANFEAINGEAAVTNINVSGDTVWHLQLKQFLSASQIEQLQVGDLYTLSASVRASEENRPGNFLFGESGGNYELAIVNYEAQLQPQTFRFNQRVWSIFPEMQVGFEMGTSNIDIFYDDVSMRKINGIEEEDFTVIHEAYGVEDLQMIGDYNGDGYKDHLAIYDGIPAFVPGAEAGVGTPVDIFPDEGESLFLVPNKTSVAVELNGDNLNDFVIRYAKTDLPEDRLNPTYGYYTFLGNSTGSVESSNIKTFQDKRETISFTQNIGDFNCDGTADIAAVYDMRVRIHYGGEDITESLETADLIIESPGGSLNYGASAAGDFNGDGCGDLALNAGAIIDGGGIYIYFGGNNPDSMADHTLLLADLYPGLDVPNTPRAYGAFAAVATPGDINGDGTDDLLFSAPFDPTRSYILLGNETLASSPQIEFPYPTGNLTALGDFNQDGKDDFSIWSYFGQNDRLFLFSGYNESNNESFSTEPFLTLQSPESAYVFFGITSDAGDFNGDGIPDLAVSPYIHNNQGMHLDAIQIYAGGVDTDGEPDHAFSVPVDPLRSIYANFPFGAYMFSSLGEIQSVPDIDGDGSDELLFGTAPFAFDITNASLFYGQDDLSQIGANGIDLVLEAPNNGTGLGSDNNNTFSSHARSAVGDFNSDGRLDVVLPQRDFNFQKQKAVIFELPVSSEGENVTFQVNMNYQINSGQYNANVGDNVYVSGAFNDWGTTPDFKMTESTDQPGVYELIAFLNGNFGSKFEYKFFVESGDDRELPNGGWEINSVGAFGNGNRTMYLQGEDHVLDEVYFNNHDGGFVTMWQSDADGVTDPNFVSFSAPGEGTINISWRNVDFPEISGSLSTPNGDGIQIQFPNPGTYFVNMKGDLSHFHFLPPPGCEPWPTAKGANTGVDGTTRGVATGDAATRGSEVDAVVSGAVVSGTFDASTFNSGVVASDAASRNSHFGGSVKAIQDGTNGTGTFSAYGSGTDASEHQPSTKNSAFCTDAAKLTGVESWGSTAWTSLEGMFTGARDLQITATDTPDFSQATNARVMFYGAENFNSPIGHWDMSNITDMTAMFERASSFNQPIGDWDVSNVTSMWATFTNASSFNQDLSSWDVSKVTDMKWMFAYSGFNSDISTWDVSAVTDMNWMFLRSPFNQPIGDWDVSSVTTMRSMFNGTPFNQSIGNWNVSNVTSTAFMFMGSGFDQPIGDWNVGNVTNMQQMFMGLYDFENGTWISENPFSQTIENWDVSSVENMAYMFANASFNQPIGNWNVSNVMDMTGMFERASSFNQPIGDWDVSNVTDMNWMFLRSPFNQPIGDWDVSSVTTMQSMFNGTPFNQSIGNWNVSNVTSTAFMFMGSGFDQPIGDWNVGNVTNMQQMFMGLYDFENGTWISENPFSQTIENWDVSSVENMAYMFANASFNQPIGNWNVGSVSTLEGMFELSQFNQPIGDWDVSSVTTMQSMFENAVSFDQNLGGWDLETVQLFYDDDNNPFGSLLYMLKNSGLSVENYDATLQGWATGGLAPSGMILHADGLVYTNQTARDILVNDFGWQITGDTFDDTVTEPVSQFYSSGWALVGMPTDAGPQHYQDLFAAPTEGTLFRFDEHYISEDSLTAGEGYWINLENGEEVTFPGNPLGEVTLSLSENWNMISGGGFSSSIQDPNNLIIEGSFYGYDGGYVTPSNILPGLGYWVAAVQPGTISITPVDGGAALSSVGGAGLSTADGALQQNPSGTSLRTSDQLDAFTRLTITSGGESESSISRELLFGAAIPGKPHPLELSLPPLPPAGAFDARLSGDRWIREESSVSVALMQGKEPVTILLEEASFDDVDRIYDLSLRLDGKEVERMVLHPGIPVTIPAGVDELLVEENRLGAGEIPSVMELSQNYPNPFNPSTTIRFGLPEAADVTLEVYNLLGQRVAMLVDGERTAGYHVVTFDAGHLSSGVYLYRLRSNGLSVTRSLNLLK